MGDAEFQAQVMEMLGDIKAEAAVASTKADAAAAASREVATLIGDKVGSQITDLHDRLFGPAGCIPQLLSRVDAENRKCYEERTALGVRVDSIEKKQFYAAAVLGGAGVAIGTYGKYLLAKLGIHVG